MTTNSFAKAPNIRIAILDFENPSKLQAKKIDFLSESLRILTAQFLNDGSFIIYDKENITELLPPNINLENCVGQCAVDTGRNLNVKYIVTGTIIRFGLGLRLTINLYDTESSRLVASETVSGKSLEAIELTLQEACQNLFRKILDRTKKLAELDDQETSRSNPDINAKIYKCQTIQESGSASVGKPFPFFSGWALTDNGVRPLNLGRILKRNKRGYLVSIISSCHFPYPCNERFKLITKARARLEQAEVDVIVIVADIIPYAKQFREKFKLNWTSVISDEFLTYSSKICPDSKDHKRLSLPRSFMLDSKGFVTLIVSEEGDDYIDLMLESL